MTVFQRTMAIVAMSLSLAGLIGTSATGSAHTLSAHEAAPGVATQMMTASFSSSNTPDRIAVPQDERAVTAELLATAIPASFATLADAVAAHAGEAGDEAVRCLAGAIYFESKGEPLAGQLAVAEVILNRARSGRFPPDVCGVVLQRGQFGFVRAGQIPAIDRSRATYRTAIAVARVALADAWNSPAAKALYFNTPGNRPAARLTKVAALGNHVFWR